MAPERKRELEALADNYGLSLTEVTALALEVAFDHGEELTHLLVRASHCGEQQRLDVVAAS